MAANQVMLGENDNLVAGSGKSFHTSITALFLPVGVIAAGYAMLLIWLLLTGSAGSGIARLCIVVLSVGIPLLIAHALLRYFTTQIRPQKHAVLLHLGFPRSEPVEVAYPLIREIHVKRGIGGRIADSGTLLFRLADGRRIAVCDLAQPQIVRDEIDQLVDGAPMLQAKVPETVKHQAIAASDR